MPHASSLDQWAEISGQAVIPVRLGRPDRDRLDTGHVPADSDFRATVERVDLSADVSVSRLASDVCRVDRTEHLVRTDPADTRAFFFHFAGAGILEQGGRQGRVGVGEGMVANLGAAYRLDYQDRSDKAIIQIGAHLLDQAAYEAMAVRTIRADVPSLTVLRGFTAQMLSHGSRLSAEQRQLMGVVMGDLIRAVVHTSLEGRRVNPTGREALLRVVQDDVRRRLGDPGLSPATLAERHHVSLRHLHVLFSGAGTTPGAYIRERRLEQAAQLLDDPSQDHLTTAAVGFRCGFADPTTFTRAFRRHHGHSPSDRRAARRLAAR